MSDAQQATTGWTPCTPENECSDPGARECRCRRLQEPTTVREAVAAIGILSDMADLLAEHRRLRLIEIAARNVAVNANRGNDGVSAVPGCLIDDLREALQ